MLFTKQNGKGGCLSASSLLLCSFQPYKTWRNAPRCTHVIGLLGERYNAVGIWGRREDTLNEVLVAFRALSKHVLGQQEYRCSLWLFVGNTIRYFLRYPGFPGRVTLTFQPSLSGQVVIPTVFASSHLGEGSWGSSESCETVQSLLCNYYIEDCKVFSLVRDLTCDAGWSGWQLASFSADVWYLALQWYVWNSLGEKYTANLAGCWGRSSSLSPALAHTFSWLCLHVVHSPCSSGDPVLLRCKNPVTGSFQVLRYWKVLVSLFNTKT